MRGLSDSVQKIITDEWSRLAGKLHYRLKFNYLIVNKTCASKYFQITMKIIHMTLERNENVFNLIPVKFHYKSTFSSVNNKLTAWSKIKDKIAFWAKIWIKTGFYDSPMLKTMLLETNFLLN